MRRGGDRWGGKSHEGASRATSAHKRRFGKQNRAASGAEERTTSSFPPVKADTPGAYQVGNNGARTTTPRGVWAITREDRVSGYNNQSESEDAFEHEDNTGKGLRAALEKALKKIERLEEAQAKTSASDVLKDAGIDPALAELVPKDTDPAEWVAQYGPLLGARPKTLEEEKKPGAAEERIEVPLEEDIAVTAEREARAAMGEAQSSGSASVYSTDVLERLNKINSEEELMKFFKNNGAE